MNAMRERNTLSLPQDNISSSRFKVLFLAKLMLLLLHQNTTKEIQKSPSSYLPKKARKKRKGKKGCFLS